MAELLDYLKQAVETQASDLFIVAGGPVSVKRDGHLCPVSGEKVFPQETERLISGIYALAQRPMEAFTRAGDDDFSFAALRKGKIWSFSLPVGATGIFKRPLRGLKTAKTPA